MTFTEKQIAVMEKRGIDSRMMAAWLERHEDKKGMPFNHLCTGFEERYMGNYVDDFDFCQRKLVEDTKDSDMPFMMDPFEPMHWVYRCLDWDKVYEYVEEDFEHIEYHIDGRKQILVMKRHV